MVLTPEVAVFGIAIGLVLALVSYLVTDISPGGMSVPGWIALIFLVDWQRGLVILLVAAATFAVAKGIGRVVILYGNRLFASVVLAGMFLEMTVLLVLQGGLVDDGAAGLFTGTLGFVVPGLIAHRLLRQPVVPTVVSLAAVSALAVGATLAATGLGVVGAA